MLPSEAPDRVAQLPVLKIRYVWIARRGHPALRKMPLSKEAFASLPHLAISPREGPTNRVDDVLMEAGLRRNTVLTIPHFLAAPMIVERTDLVAIIDESIARLFLNNTNVKVHELPVKLRPITINMQLAAIRATEPALKWLRDQCLEVARTIGAPS
jgi:DNA-binding transcriptional LysR family regulator